VWSLPGTPILHTGRRVTHPNTTDTLIEVWDDGAGAWVVDNYDSGWRDIASLASMPGSATLTLLRVRRTLHRVSFAMYWADSQTNPSRVAFLTLPAGFRPPTTSYFSVPYDSNTAGSTMRYLFVGTNGSMEYGGPTQSSGFAGSHSWDAAATLPSSLPGTPA